MTISDVSSTLLNAPGGVWILLVVILVFGSTAIFSEKTAKEKFGALGLVSRWWKRRKEEAANMEEEISSKRTAELWDEIQRVDELRARDREYFEEQITRLERAEKLQHRYITWVTDVFRRIEIWAAGQGYELPPPPFKTYIEWLDEGGELDGHPSMGNRPHVD